MPALCVEPGIPEPPPVSCVTAVPILKKMKVLKKFKQRMGRGSRSESSQLPALLFHQVCGDNVRIENGGRVARRVESFCKGISFSNRPVKVGEKIYVKLLEISSNWSGVIRFGFTTQDPTGLRDALPKYACPDLTSKPGYWAKALSERFAEEGLVLFYYVTSSGDVHFGINGEEKGLFFSGVETRSPLWGIVDVYGNSTAIEFLDPKLQLNNRVRIVNNDLRPESTTSSSHHRILSASQQSQLHQHYYPPPSQAAADQRLTSGTIRNVEAMNSSMVQLALEKLTSRYYPAVAFSPFAFHRVRGRHVQLNEDRSLATRVESEYSHGYVFTGRPLRPGERFMIKVLETEPVYVGALAFGLTAANPAGLEATTDLPEDCDLLLDRPEYWVVSKDVASSPVAGDELTFGLTNSGEVTFSKNNGPPQTVMHVDISLQLWPFFDVYGNTKKIRMLGLLQHEDSPNNNNESNAHADSRRSNSGVSSVRPNVPRNPFTHSSPTEYQNRARMQLMVEKESSINSRCRSEPKVMSRTTTTTSSAKEIQSAVSPQHPTYSPGSSSSSLSPSQHECTICYEKLVDSVLYMCGHMCMCYECALQQWQGRGGGLCPICRAPIRDVIRTYRS